MKTLKEVINTGDSIVGMWLALGSSYTAEICATGGFDFVLIDAEHGPNDVLTTLQQLQVLAAYPVHSIVRIPNKDSSLIKRYLDVGTVNILAPFINTAKEAQDLVYATRYAPEGIRGSGYGLGRVSQWGKRTDYPHIASREITLIAQIETTEGLENLEAICVVDGIDAVFFGPADIAASIGKIGQYADAKVVDLILGGMAKAKSLGMPIGVYTADPKLLAKYKNAGASIFGVASDTGILASGARSLAREFSALVE